MTWLKTLQQPEAPKSRLVCMPYAGGGAYAFAAWTQLLPRDCRVEAVALPGRAPRFREAPAEHIAEVADNVARELSIGSSLPTVLFGHSMGALLAFETARRMGPQSVRHLVLSGRAAPSHERAHRGWASLGDDDCVRLLRSLGGTPPELLANEELLNLAIPILRADFAMVERYRFEPQPLLDYPITALVGSSDSNASAEAAKPWGDLTSGPFRLVVVEGGHFFLHESRDAVVAVLTAAIASPDSRVVVPSQTGAGPMRSPLPSASPETWAVPTSPIQEEALALERLLPPGTFTIRAAYRVDPATDLTAVLSALREVIRRHESLRTSFVRRAGRYQQVVHRDVEAVTVVPVSSEVAASDDSLRAMLADSFRDLLVPTQPPLVRATVFSVEGRPALLALLLHHMIADGWSLGIIERELSTLIRSGMNRLPELRLHYADYAIWQREHLSEPSIRAQLAFWDKELKGTHHLFAEHGGVEMEPRHKLIRLPADATRALRDVAKAEAATLFVAATAVLCVIVSLQGVSEFVAGTVAAGRPTSELLDVVGYFANIFPLRLSIHDDDSFRRLIQRIRSRLSRALDHQDIPFFQLARANADLRRRDAAGRRPAAILIQPYERDFVGGTSSTLTPFHWFLPDEGKEAPHLQGAPTDWCVFFREDYAGLRFESIHDANALDDSLTGRLDDFVPICRRLVEQPDAPLDAIRREFLQSADSASHFERGAS